MKLNACFHWLLKIKNWKQYFVYFQFPSQIEFWEQFLFSVHFGLPNKFFSLKNRKLFLKIENKGKKQLANIPLDFGPRQSKGLGKLKITKTILIGYLPKNLHDFQIGPRIIGFNFQVQFMKWRRSRLLSQFREVKNSWGFWAHFMKWKFGFYKLP